MPLTSHSRNTENGLYGPITSTSAEAVPKEAYYQSKEDHRRTAKKKEDKNRWIIKEGEEFDVFRISFIPHFFCNVNQCLFSLVDDASTELGFEGERVAKFPKPQNGKDAWHGYPVSCEREENRPSDELLDKLVGAGAISETTRSRIERKKI